MPGTATQTQRLRWDIEWRTAVFALLLVPLFLALGAWQLGRADEKRMIAERWESQRKLQAQPIENLDQESDGLAYRPVLLRGDLLADRNFLLDNRMRDGRYGVEVISPLRLESGALVLVNRGWLAADPYRRALPDVPGANVESSLRGYVYVPTRRDFTLGEIADDSEWPRLVQTADPAGLGELLGEAVYPYIVRLDPDSPASLLADWPLMNAAPEKHEAYAAQWFAMAVVLAGFAVWRNTNLPALRRERKRKDT
jgi:surfeit locus 1 family protein